MNGASPAPLATAPAARTATARPATPEGDKVGSAVREVSVTHGWQPLPESQPQVTLKGEAVVVDLGQRGVVFGLLTNHMLGADYGSDVAGYTIPHTYPDLSPEGIEEMTTIVTPPIPLSERWYPTFVYFKDRNDPKTVTKLMEYDSVRNKSGKGFQYNYTIKTDHFAEAFGQGVALKSVTIEMTKDPVTLGETIKYLPWLPEYRNKMFDGQRYNTIKSEFPFANSLAKGAFTAGEK